MQASTTPPTDSPQRFFSDVRFTLFAKVLYLLTRLALPPLILSRVDLADYGIWSICFILISYLGLSVTGVASVYVRNGALAHRRGDTPALSRLLSTGICGVLLVAVVVMAAIWAGLPHLLNWLDVAVERRALAEWMLLGSSAVFLADLSLGAHAYILHGMGKIRLAQQIWVASFLLEMVILVALLLSGWGVEALLAAFALRYVFSISIAAWLTHRLLPGLRVSPALFDRSLLPDFLGFGMLVQVSALCANALHSVERVLAGVFFGSAAAAIFDLGNKLPSTAISIPSAVSTVTLPSAARAENRAEIARLYLRSTRLSACLAALPMPFLALFALPLIQLWLGNHPELASIAGIMGVLSVSLHLHIVTGPGSSIFRGCGKAGNEFIYHGLRVALLGIAVAIAMLTSTGGLSMITLANAIAAGGSVASLIYLAWNHRALTGRLAGFARQVLWPTLVCYPAALVTRFLIEHAGLWSVSTAGRTDALLPVLLGGSFYSLLALGSLYFGVLDDDQRTQLRSRLRPSPANLTTHLTAQA